MDAHDFGTGRIAARVRAAGAELCSLRFEGGPEMLWQAGPAWPRQAPVLFPIVGRLAGDTLRHAGREYRLTQHGFARDRRFRFLSHTPTGCVLELASDAETRALYPWGFRLRLGYEVDETTLRVTFQVENTGTETLPASVGAHPAFRWPLAPGLPKAAHRLVFERDEPGAVRRLADGLLLPDSVPSPVAGRVLALTDTLFAHDAVILERPASRRVRYEAAGPEARGLDAPGSDAPAVTVAWTGFETLGIWSKPADFVCIEPWSGIASTVVDGSGGGDGGEFVDKPGLVHIPPGDAIERTMDVTLHPPGG